MIGTCPHCGGDIVSRERKPDGNDECENGHNGPSKDTMPWSVFNSIVKWKELHEDDLMMFQVGKAQFRIDFGPWKKDEHVFCLCFNLAERTVIEYNAGDKPMKQAKLELVCKNT